MSVVYVIGVLIILGFSGILLLRRKGRAVVDKSVIWVRNDSHCTALVHYRDEGQVLRFGAEVTIPHKGEYSLYIDLPSKMYTDNGRLVSDEKLAVIKQRLSRGLKQLGILHEFSPPETGS